MLKTALSGFAASPVWTVGRELTIEMAITAAICLIVTFGLTVLLLRLILPVLVAKKVGQSIREEGPEWHKSKAGTPTMGGICFIIAILVSTLALFVIWTVRGDTGFRMIPMALTLAFGVANAMIGFVDDYCKLLKKQNEGLTAKQKFVLQMFVAAAYLAMMAITGNLTTALYIPFVGATLELGYAAYVLYLLVIVGFVNSTNLTDGLDGLASSVAATVAVFMLVCSFLTYNSPELAAISSALLGGMLGFLVYNHHPAKVFMGDTGSLFLGGIIIGCAMMQGQLLVFIIAGFVFVFEMLSSLLQVLYFKATHGKRLFKMAPFHHHLEKCGYGEGKVVTTFVVVTAVLSIIAFFGIR